MCQTLRSRQIETSNSVRRPTSKGTKSKNRVLKKTKSLFADVQKISRSISIYSNKCETKDLNVCQTNASVSNSKTANVVNDSSNIVYVSCGKDVFLLSHEKCVACYALSRNSNVKRSLFTTLVAAKSKNLGTTSVVAKSRLSVANTPKATNKVFSASSLSHDSSQSKTLSNYMKNKIATSRKWQRWFEYQQSFNWSPKSKTARSLPSETMSRIHVLSKSNTPVTTQKWVAKLSTLPSAFVPCDAGLGHNLFLVRQFCDGDLEVAFCSNTYYVRNLEGDDLLTNSRESNLYTISISEMAAFSPVCLMFRATSTKSWLWHRRLSHLNFGTINQLTSKDLVDELPKFKYNKDHLCSTCEQGKSKKASLPPKLVPGTESKLELLHMDLYGPMRLNHSIVHTWYNKTPYELIQGRNPNIQYFHVFRSLCYPTNDRDDIMKMKLKADIGIFIGYSGSSRGFCIYNRRTKNIIETIHVKFDELITMASECNNLEPGINYINFQDSLEDS
ncbi:retrovirus-related pol polyprotein from transposon TNT 1-94 [Tanacetum coccineum]